MSIIQYTSAKRIILVDALRGLALMGLFMVHMVEYFELYWYKPEQSIFNDITFFLFGGKAYAVFAMLFGLSFFIIIDNQAKKGIDFRGRYCWRLMLLLIAGFIHGLLYGGDILIILAVAGFFLLPLYNIKTGFLVFLSLFFLLQGPAIIYYLTYFNTTAPGNPAHWGLYGDILNVYANGSFPELLNITLWKSQAAKWAFMLESGRLSIIIGISIAGLLAGRFDFFRKTLYYRKYIIYFSIAFLLSAIILTFTRQSITQFFSISENWFSSAILSGYNDLLYTAAGILIFTILFNTIIGNKILSFLAPAGKLSLTIYISQSVIFVPFFYGFGIGAYNFIGQTWSFFLGILFWLLQLFIAWQWNKYYYFGPFEWLWRSATYMRTGIKFRKT